jgi:hypothetical protein
VIAYLYQAVAAREKTTKDTKDTKISQETGRIMELVYKEESYKIIGACFEVY